MEETSRKTPVEAEINLAEYGPVLRSAWWKILSLSFAVGILVLIGLSLLPNIYRSTAVIAPIAEEEKKIPSLGSLTATLGISIGGPTRVEDLESLFRSNDLTIRVFRKSNPWQILLVNRYDPKIGEIRFSLLDRLLGEAKGSRPPSDWDAIRMAKKGMEVSVNKRSGTVSVSFESPSAKGSAEMVQSYLEEGKSRLQEEALERASKNKKFIEEQIGRTLDPLTRDRLYALFGQEVEKEMMARNREQFGFRIIDHPLVPDRKSKPQRAVISLLAILLSCMLWAMVFIIGAKRKAPPRGQTPLS